MNRWIMLLLYAVAGAAAVYYHEELLLWLQHGDRGDIPLMILIATLFALVPVLPYGVIAGAMGAKFGTLAGGLINVTGSALAAVLMFWLVRHAFARQGRAYLARMNSLDRFTRMVERRPFIAVLFARLIPILPAPAVNIYAGISKMGMGPYTLATVAGKIPVMLLLAIVGEQVFSAPENLPLVVLIYAAFLAVVWLLYRWWERGRGAVEANPHKSRGDRR